MTEKRKPDILLLVLDTVRADRLSCYGYGRPTTPHLDAFAEGGTLFERAISPAQWTIPAHASLFTGEYPSTHGTTQIYDKHSEDQLTLAEALHENGYLTVGFCNNPLLGIVENGLERGFEEFYNYGGTFPNRPAVADARPSRVQRVAQYVLRLMRRVVAPIQDQFARNKMLLRIALHPRIVPLWRRYLNFKGNTTQSVRDLLGYLRTRMSRDAERPVFAFVNLMETHLPYGPRPRFVRRFAPYYRNDRRSREFMQGYNQQHYRWMIPLDEPLEDWQSQVINDMYDAEMATEDALLRRVYAFLDQPEVRENTLVIVTSDHGEGLNNHNFVGHSLVAYDDLLRVPLIIRYPERYPADKRVQAPVSTRRVFHSVLEAAGVHPAGHGAADEGGTPVEVERLSLARTAEGRDPEQGIVFSEAFTPDTLIALMEGQDQKTIDRFRCRSMRRAAYRGAHKLITVADQPDELFDVLADPGELENLLASETETAELLDGLLTEFRAYAKSRRPAEWRAAKLRLEDDAEVTERLRGLGYLE